MIYRASQILGVRIAQLREARGLSSEELAGGAGVANENLRAIETGTVPGVSPAVLARIADGLHMASAQEFTDLMRLNPNLSRFKAYSVGIGKTGTMSMAHIFGAYRSYHQYLMSETLDMIRRHCRGDVSRTEFRDFILERDAAAQLEMDSSGHHYYYVNILADEFPSAKFIFVIRDCYSWFDSVSNMLHLPNSGFTSPGDYDFDALKPICEDEARLLRELGDHLDGPLEFWTSANRKTLDALPPERTLIVRTNEISARLDDMAEFIDVPAESLNAQQSHVHKAVKKLDILKKADFDALEAKFNQHCGALMEKFFPNYALKDYLADNPIPAHPQLKDEG